MITGNYVVLIAIVIVVVIYILNVKVRNDIVTRIFSRYKNEYITAFDVCYILEISKQDFESKYEKWLKNEK